MTSIGPSLITQSVSDQSKQLIQGEILKTVKFNDKTLTVIFHPKEGIVFKVQNSAKTLLIRDIHDIPAQIKDNPIALRHFLKKAYFIVNPVHANGRDSFAIHAFLPLLAGMHASTTRRAEPTLGSRGAGAAVPRQRHVQPEKVIATKLPISFSPITIKGLLEEDKDLLCVYEDQQGVIPQFVPIAEKIGGTLPGTKYQKIDDQTIWLGKINTGTGRVARMVTDSDISHTIKEMNVASILEEIAYALIKAFTSGMVRTPQTFLSKLNILDRFTEDNYLAQMIAERLATPGEDPHHVQCLRIMTEFIDGYQDFSKARTRTPIGETIFFVEFIKRFHTLPEQILNPSDELVPLIGGPELLAVMRMLGDTDGLGGTGMNAGFVWKYQNGVVAAAEVVKIDPGETFRFDTTTPGSINRLRCTRDRRGNTSDWLADQRDIQTANQNHDMTIHWSAMTPNQKERYLCTIMNSMRYKHNKGVLDLLLNRQGKFNRSELEQIPPDLIEQLIEQINEWFDLNPEIYRPDLQDLLCRRPELLLAIQYLDHYGELPLPNSGDTFPIRELVTDLALFEQKKIKEGEREDPDKPPALMRDINLPERDSVSDTFRSLSTVETLIKLEELFDRRDAERDVQKVLMVGRAGIGKSTMCEKIGHDSVSGRLWNKMILWLPLRQCNNAVQPGEFLYGIDDVERWLALAIAKLRFDPEEWTLYGLNREELAINLYAKIKNEKKKIVVLLDGYDEASAEVAQIVARLLQIEGLNILVTSRPGVTAALLPFVQRRIENKGFSDRQLIAYSRNFFTRRGMAPLDAEKILTSFLKALKANSTFYVIAHVPLNLQMLCALWESNASRDGFPSTLTGLYRSMTHETMCWQSRKEGGDFDALPLFEQQKLLGCLGEIALRGLENGQLMIPEAILMQSLDRFGLTKAQILTSGLLKISRESALNEYSFLHLSFQEYLIALTVSRTSAEECRRFVLMHRTLPHFQLVLGFLSGILHEESAREGIAPMQNFFGWLHEPGADMTGIFQFELMLRCLNECQSPELHTWADGEYRIQETLLSLIGKIILEKKDADHPIALWMGTMFLRYPLALKEKEVPIIQALERALQSTDSNIRSNATEALGEIAKGVPDQVSRLIELLLPLHGSHIVTEAIIKIAKAGPEQAVRLIEPLLSLRGDEDRSVRQLVALVLEEVAKIGLEQAARLVDPLISLLGDEDHYIRDSALRALIEVAKSGPDQAARLIEPLLSFLGDENPVVRNYALEALREVAKSVPEQAARLIEPLLPLFQDISLDVRTSATGVLGEVAKGGLEQTTRIIEVLLQNKDFLYYSAQAFGEVAKSGLKQATLVIETLLPLLRDRDYRVRSSTAIVLGEVAKSGPEQAVRLIEPLLLLLRDEDYWVRSKAAEALKEVAKSAPEQSSRLFEPLLPLLRDEHHKFHVTGTLAEVVKSRPAQTARFVEHFLPLLRDEYNRHFAVHALIEVTKSGLAEATRLIKSLSPFLRDKDSYLRSCVVEGLGEVAKSTPSQAALVIETILPLLRDKDSNFSVAKTLVEVAKSGPAQAIHLVEPLLLLIIDEDSSVQYNAGHILEEVAKSVPEQTARIIEPLLPVLRDKYHSGLNSVQVVLIEVAKSVPDQVVRLLEHLLPLLRDEDSTVRDYTARMLGEAAKSRPEQAICLLEHLLPLLQDESSSVRSSVEENLKQIPQEVYLKYLARPNGAQIIPILVKLAAMRELPLYLAIRDGETYLCLVKNHEEIAQLITRECMDAVQNYCRKQSALNPYVSTYMR